MEEKAEELLAKAERDAKRKDQKFQEIVSYLISKFIEMSQGLDSAIDAIRGWSSFSAAQKGIIGDILALGSKNPEKTVEFLNLLARGHSTEMSRARDYVKRAQQTLQALSRSE